MYCRVPVEATNCFVFSELLICEDLMEHQSIGHLPWPVTSFKPRRQSLPVIQKHVYDLFLLQGKQHPKTKKQYNWLC